MINHFLNPMLLVKNTNSGVIIYGDGSKNLCDQIQSDAA